MYSFNIFEQVHIRSLYTQCLRSNKNTRKCFLFNQLPKKKINGYNSVQPLASKTVLPHLAEMTLCRHFV